MQQNTANLFVYNRPVVICSRIAIGTALRKSNSNNHIGSLYMATTKRVETEDVERWETVVPRVLTPRVLLEESVVVSSLSSCMVECVAAPMSRELVIEMSSYTSELLDELVSTGKCFVSNSASAVWSSHSSPARPCEEWGGMEPRRGAVSSSVLLLEDSRVVAELLFSPPGVVCCESFVVFKLGSDVLFWAQFKFTEFLMLEFLKQN